MRKDSTPPAIPAGNSTATCRPACACGRPTTREVETDFGTFDVCEDCHVSFGFAEEQLSMRLRRAA